MGLRSALCEAMLHDSAGQNQNLTTEARGHGENIRIDGFLGASGIWIHFNQVRFLRASVSFRAASTRNFAASSHLVNQTSVSSPAVMGDECRWLKLSRPSLPS